MGRGRALEKRMRPVITPQAGEDGNADFAMRGLSLIHLRFAELAAYVLKFANKPEQCGEQFVLQWISITEQLRKPRGLLAEFLREDLSWEMRVLVVGHSSYKDLHLRPSILQWAGVAKKEVKSRRDAQTLVSRTGFRKWVAEQLRNGAGGLHALARRTEPPIEAAVHTHAAKTAQVLEAEFAKAEKMRQKKRRGHRQRQVRLPMAPAVVRGAGV